MNFYPHDINTWLVSSRTRIGHHIIEYDEGCVRCSCEGFGFYNTCEHTREFRRQFNLVTYDKDISVCGASFLIT